MFNVTLLDNQQVVVTTNPQTLTNRPLATTPFNFGVTNPNQALLDITIANGVNPTFTVKPKIRFFGDPQIVTLTIHAQTKNLGPTINTPMTVTVMGSEPDNGELDHFAPAAGDPVPQP